MENVKKRGRSHISKREKKVRHVKRGKRIEHAEC
jgi:hypothetical protein